MSTTETPEKIEKFEPFTKLYRRERISFENLVSQINTFLAKDKDPGEIIYVPIQENPQKRVVLALEEYFKNKKEGWKQLRILLDRNWTFAVLTKNETFG